MSLQQYSAISDIGRHPIRLSADVARVVLDNCPERDDIAAIRAAEVFADYLSSARVIAQVPDRNGRRVDALSDGNWTWLRTSAFYARAYKVADIQLLAHAAAVGFILPDGWLNPDWRPPTTRTTAGDLDREEYRTWRD